MILQGGSVGSGHDFRGLSPRPPSTSMSWDAPNQGSGSNVRNTLNVGAALTKYSSSSTGILQPSTSDGLACDCTGIAFSSSVERSPPPFARR